MTGAGRPKPNPKPEPRYSAADAWRESFGLPPQLPDPPPRYLASAAWLDANRVAQQEPTEPTDPRRRRLVDRTTTLARQGAVQLRPRVVVEDGVFVLAPADQIPLHP